MKVFAGVAALAAASANIVFADTGNGVGSWVDVPHDVMTLPNKNTYTMSRSRQIWFSENLPRLNNVALDCFTTWINVKGSDEFFSRGWCSGVDADGDVMWSDFDMGADGGTWTWSAFYPDGLWGTWTWTYDSAWQGGYMVRLASGESADGGSI